jgi:hypothetical protein
MLLTGLLSLSQTSICTRQALCMRRAHLVSRVGLQTGHAPRPPILTVGHNKHQRLTPAAPDGMATSCSASPAPAHRAPAAHAVRRVPLELPHKGCTQQSSGSSTACICNTIQHTPCDLITQGTCKQAGQSACQTTNSRMLCLCAERHDDTQLLCCWPAAAFSKLLHGSTH